MFFIEVKNLLLSKRDVAFKNFLDEIPQNLIEYHQPKELTDEEIGDSFSSFLSELKSREN